MYPTRSRHCSRLEACVLLSVTLASAAGSPPGDTVPASFDCDMRRLALSFARDLQPSITLGQLRDIADALNGAPDAQCHNLTVRDVTVEKPRRSEAAFSTGTGRTVFVSPSGDDFAAGTVEAPFRTIQRAVMAAKGGTVELRAGFHRVARPLQLTPEDSGLTIRSYRGERAVISGAALLAPAWRLFEKKASGHDVYVADIPSEVGDIYGLRVDGRRSIRARYPNADPSTTLNPQGWIASDTKWLSPLVTHESNPPVEYVVDDPKWTRHDSAGNELKYQGGIGGSCQHFEPPFGYWCSSHPNRTADGSLTHRWPSGVAYEGQLPHAPYKKAEGAIVHTCRGGGDCWFTWMFEVDAHSVVNKTLTWTHGGFQGAEGSDTGGSWFIENVFEELDVPNEYFFYNASRKLYYVLNATAGKPISNIVFEAVVSKVLLNASGTMDDPVKDVSIEGLEFRDTAYTFMDPHGMPSGGDWGLQRSGALTFAGTERTRVDRCLLGWLDGIGISINGYNRDFVVTGSEFKWLGESAIAAWGYTKQGLGGGSVTLPKGVGIDGAGGEQPRGTRIVGNIFHEFGIIQKQSSAFFQAQSCQTVIEGNIFYNGPRAHINFNDQFGGGNLISRNLIFNACRETADHGPFNSWGRMPFITDVRDGTPSIVPAPTTIKENFVIGSYHTQEAIDNDDATEYFETHHNFFVYGENGLKSDFAGHDNWHHNNVYAFLKNTCLGVGSFLPGHEDAFFNNTCIMMDSCRYASLDCGSAALPRMHDNRIFSPNGLEPSVCGKAFSEWQASGQDKDSSVGPWPTSDVLVQLGAATLGMRFMGGEHIRQSEHIFV
eukprot:TRINITY_DN23259_c0_g1_i1.p1 TRINITY_DN23259_c0_g1~~TRINITY_DN23259_c0_g1_i1.p1  ORF type:complete len:828 (+),score=100.29 TRINITY_DN23259_c0_g1_i1:55-2538(+)